MSNMPDTGDALPAFELDTNGGGRISSADLAGSSAVIFFYPKDDTPGCTKEAVGFSALKPEFDKAGIKLLGISADPPAKHDKFVAKHNLTVTLGADPELDTLKAFGVWAEKSMYGKKYFGIERTTFLVGKDGKIARVWRKVKVPGHAEEVLAAARKL